MRTQTMAGVNIAYGERTTLNELWKEINTLAGTDLSPIYGPERKGDVKHSLANIGKAQELIGYKPQFSVKEGLRVAMEWYKKR